eukprot:Sspe_Gene.58288::Locus_31967_Transcript_2_4_Confidence_0.400_Length_1661::g.58288::m.58288
MKRRQCTTAVLPEVDAGPSGSPSSRRASTRLPSCPHTLPQLDSDTPSSSPSSSSPCSFPAPSSPTAPLPPERKFGIGTKFFGGEYVLTDHLGTGAFGSVYRARYTSTGVQVAIKVASNPQHVQLLKHEAYAYAQCQACVDGLRVPKAHWAGPCQGAYILILELLGCDLETKLEECGGKFSPQTTAMLGVQMLDILRKLHNHVKFVHRDVKPANFVLKGEREVFLLDLGFTKSYWDSHTQSHASFRQSTARFLGTPRYASRHSHEGIQQSRRDDLESLGYTLLHFYRGTLPWFGLKGDEIAKMKSTISIEQLTQSHPYLTQYFRMVFALEYDEEPDYDALRTVLISWLESLGARMDRTRYDWEVANDLQPGRAMLPPLDVAVDPTPGEISGARLLPRPAPPTTAPRRDRRRRTEHAPAPGPQRQRHMMGTGSKALQKPHHSDPGYLPTPPSLPNNHNVELNYLLMPNTYEPIPQSLCQLQQPSSLPNNHNVE